MQAAESTLEADARSLESAYASAIEGRPLDEAPRILAHISVRPQVTSVRLVRASAERQGGIRVRRTPPA